MTYIKNEPISPLDGGLISRAPKGDGGQSSLLTHPLDGGLISRAPKGDGGQSSLLDHKDL